MCVLLAWDWQNMSRFVFERIRPASKGRLDEKATVIVQATGTDEPTVRLNFRAEAVGMVVSALKEALRYGRP
jgi:hypothetical protein